MNGNWFYQFARYVGKALFSLYAPITARGLENIPMSGAFVIASNHLSYVDPIVITISCPRRIGFLSKIEVQRNALLGVLVRPFQAIPVDRDNPQPDTARQALRLLRSGRPLMIAPEGTRSLDGNLQDFKPGFMKLAHAAGVPVLPAVIRGTHRVWPPNQRLPRPGRITVTYGQVYADFLKLRRLSGEDLLRHVEAVRAIIASIQIADSGAG